MGLMLSVDGSMDDDYLWVLWAEFTLVSHLSPTLVSHSGFLGSHVQYN